MHSVDFILAEFEESPAFREFFGAQESGGDQVEALASDSLIGLEAKGLDAVGYKIGARDFAFDQHGVAGALPANGVRHLAADASLLGQHYAAAVAAQPLDGF